MKNMFSKKLITVALAATFSQGAYAIGGCDNSGNGLNSWGAWCDIGEFLGQKDATASGGPLFGNSPNVGNSNFDANSFGGKVNDNPESEFMGYALVLKGDENTSVLARVYLDNNADNKTMQAKAVLEDGTVLSFNLNKIYDKQTNKLSNKTNNGTYTSHHQGIETYTHNHNYKGHNEAIYTYAGNNYPDPNSAEQNPPHITDDEHFAFAYLSNHSGTEFQREVDGTHETTTWTSTFEDQEYYGSMYFYEAPKSEQGRETLDARYLLDSGSSYIGKPTSLASMNNISGTVQLPTHYWGTEETTKGLAQIYGFTDVTVNFDNKTWKANNLMKTNAQGIISGNKIESTSLIANDSNYNVKAGSYINGQFVGPNAKHMLGQGSIGLENKIDSTDASVIKAIFATGAGPS